MRGRLGGQFAAPREQDYTLRESVGWCFSHYSIVQHTSNPLLEFNTRIAPFCGWIANVTRGEVACVPQHSPYGKQQHAPLGLALLRENAAGIPPGNIPLPIATAIGLVVILLGIAGILLAIHGRKTRRQEQYEKLTLSFQTIYRL